MPIVSVKMTRGRTEEKKQELVAAITQDVVRILNVSPEWVTVVIDEYDRENWASGGQLHSVKYGAGHGTAGTEPKKARSKKITLPDELDNKDAAPETSDDQNGSLF
ncbi:MAG: tautomerase family protein [Candidatus Saccharibacteria bacterium]